MAWNKPSPKIEPNKQHKPCDSSLKAHMPEETKTAQETQHHHLTNRANLNIVVMCNPSKCFVTFPLKIKIKTLHCTYWINVSIVMLLAHRNVGCLVVSCNSVCLIRLRQICYSETDT